VAGGAGEGAMARIYAANLPIFPAGLSPPQPDAQRQARQWRRTLFTIRKGISIRAAWIDRYMYDEKLI